MRFEEWQADVPLSLSMDPLWRKRDYRLALYSSELGWADVARLQRYRATRGIADQLLRALGSISANLAEGYSRSSGPDRCRYYEYALGSARESRDWYYKSRRVLGQEVVEARIDILTSVVRILMRSIPAERVRTLRPSTCLTSSEAGVRPKAP